MARSNYSYAKRLKEIARQKKQEEKRLKKQAKSEGRPEGEAWEIAEERSGVDDGEKKAGNGTQAQ